MDSKLKYWNKQLQNFIELLSTKNELQCEALKKIVEKIKYFENFIPIIETCSTKALKQKHWDQVIIELILNILNKIF